MDKKEVHPGNALPGAQQLPRAGIQAYVRAHHKQHRDGAKQIQVGQVTHTGTQDTKGNTEVQRGGFRSTWTGLRHEWIAANRWTMARTRVVHWVRAAPVFPVALCVVGLA